MAWFETVNGVPSSRVPSISQSSAVVPGPKWPIMAAIFE
jgi:hypothetical protein